ncbi:hypothetical protein TL10_27385 [Mycolicibacterium llatzerense]|uniref:Uncharacterized protein n=1 Tax=Mycolicibacterium llatzerense TaxID=280871 RepID=A0A0D1LDC3_9MYCO|nr:hypothetical protein TL10_27385 [Mycolicibacterium llatzerense]MCT7371244.1 hypothetical protein [Mycolicibacterium llatzerense]
MRATRWRQFVGQGLAADRGGLATKYGLGQQRRGWRRQPRQRGIPDCASGRAETIGAAADDESIGDDVVNADRPGWFAVNQAAVPCSTGVHRRY